MSFVTNLLTKSVRSACFSRAVVASGSPISFSLSRALSSEAEGAGAAMRHKSEIGKEYHELMHRGRGGNRLALGDFKLLCMKISDPLDVKHAIHAAELFQIKGQDFSEETNSQFISACLRGNNPEAVFAHFAKRKHRLSAWTTPTAFVRLLEALYEREVLPDNFIDVVRLLKEKGVYFNKATVEMLEKMAEKHGDSDFKDSLRGFTQQMQ